MFKAFSMIATASLMAVPATAQISFDDSQPKSAQANPSDNKLICEKEEAVGSRVSARKVCLTKSQWDERRREHRETLEKFQQQNTSTGTPSG